MSNYNNIKGIFKRMDIQEIRNFLVENGQSSIGIDTRPYELRLEEESEDLINSLKRCCKNKEEFNEALEDFNNAVQTFQDVFTEIGMKAGARLLFQLLYQDD
ncbi:MAG: hypothetical protein FWD71_14845 [Oscillospiraceae bacterium]|nr:hypothetical protein [Oscillospiraceae bacterium]